MKFEPTDYNWRDWHSGLTSERSERFYQIIDATMDRLEEVLKKHHRPGLHLKATVPIGIFSTGVRGDAPMYAPIVMLFYNKRPSYKRLASISKDITNTLPISRVIATSFHLCP